MCGSEAKYEAEKIREAEIERMRERRKERECPVQRRGIRKKSRWGGREARRAE